MDVSKPLDIFGALPSTAGGSDDLTFKKELLQQLRSASRRIYILYYILYP
jgi:hypothetical protein